MTARPHAGPRQGRAEDAATVLIIRLTAVLQARMTTANHPYALIEAEHRGTCPAQYCSDRCVEYRALYREAVAYLRSHETEAPTQPTLWQEAI